MSRKTLIKLPLEWILALLLLASGGLFGIYSLVLGTGIYPDFAPAAFLDTVAIPFNEVKLGDLSIPIELDNYLVFQEFKALAPQFTVTESLAFGGIVFLIAVTALTAFSYFKKFPFLGVGLGWIVLLTFSNVNGLNIGGPSSNYPLIILISGSLIPLVFFHVWKVDAGYLLRWLSIFVFFSASIAVLIYSSPVEKPALFLAEQALVPALIFSIAWIFWQGHAVISGIYILLAKVNQNLTTKISIQITLIALVYFLILIGLLLHLRGEVDIPFLYFNPLYLLLPIGIFGWISTYQKTQQEPNLAANPKAILSLFLLGFAMTLWLLWKLELSSNQPAEELFKHLLVYAQISFSLFFFIYLVSNFLSVMNSGKAVHRIVYKPYSLPYYHLRIGGVIGLMVISIYMDIILAAQFNSLTTNILGDYYYQTERKLEASILYENSWDRYRYNPKAKFLTAQLLFDLNQPTLAKEHLEQSFSEAPQVDNILLLCERLNRENKLYEVIYYLENGLKFFPENPRLLNNLALYYTLTQKFDQAEQLLRKSADEDPVSAANWLAFQSKMGIEADFSTVGNDLISQINALAAMRKNGVKPDESLKAEIRKKLRGNSSPMIIQAGWRNLVTEKNIADPSADLEILDSLARNALYLEYTMQLQETSSLRSLGAGRVMETVKNLNGLAFRNPGDAAYYLQLTANIQAQNLDFIKAANDLVVAEQKGFQAFRPSTISILNLGGKTEEAQRISEKFGTKGLQISPQDSSLLAQFNGLLPEKAFAAWKVLSSEPMKNQLANYLLSHKAHGLGKAQLQEIGKVLTGKTAHESDLQSFLSNPDWANKESLLAFTSVLEVSEELTANPYYTPLVLSAADRVSDPLGQYETINAASDFNRDPLLWIRKAQAAKRIGLDHYATAAIQEMSTWMTWDEIEMLQRANY